MSLSILRNRGISTLLRWGGGLDHDLIFKDIFLTFTIFDDLF